MKKRIFLHALLVCLVVLTEGCTGRENRVEPSRVLQAAAQASDEDAGVVIDTLVDVFTAPEVQSKRITQVLFNQPVRILEEKDAWTRIRTEGGDVSGWVKSRYILKDVLSAEKDNFQYKVLITAKTARINSRDSGGITLKEVMMGTELYILSKSKSAYEVILPGRQTGWVEESGTIRLLSGARIPETSPEDFAATAEKFIGTSFMEGGISFWGMDSSGLIYICGRVNGILLPRELRGQAQYGIEIPIDDIKPGDLVFYCSKNDPDELVDAGIYTGNGTFVHASRTKGYVTTGRIDDDPLGKMLITVRRIF